MRIKQQALLGRPHRLENQIIPSIPYMGNKRKLAVKIINIIDQIVGEKENFYDLFGGGASVSVSALIGEYNVYYNELNKGVAKLLKYIIGGGQIPYEWVSREDFLKNKDRDDWYGGLIKCIWSFGNQQKAYLFGKDVEPTKYLAHKLVIDKDENARKELSEMIGIDIPKGVSRQKLNRLAEAKINSREYELEQLQQLQQLEQLQQLQRLQQLERLQQLQQLQQLNITSKSYDEVEIKDNSVIYCDPPYKGTGEYQKDGFNHDKFYKWCFENKNPVFISGYEIPKEFELIKSWKHRCTLSAISNNEVVENLYWNRAK